MTKEDCRKTTGISKQVGQYVVDQNVVKETQKLSEIATFAGSVKLHHIPVNRNLAGKHNRLLRITAFLIIMN